MSKPHRQSVSRQSVKPRPGDGVPIDVIVDQFVATDGTSVANLGINAAELEVPDRRYTADMCAVSANHGTVRLIFAQERVDDSGWRSLVVVNMSNEAARRFLSTLRQMGGPSLDEIAIASELRAEPLATKMSEPDPGQAISLSANMVFTAVSGNEACLDFYQASPFAMMAVFASKQLALEPIVRVDLRTSLLLGLIDGLKSHGIVAQELKTRGGPA